MSNPDEPASIDFRRQKALDALLKVQEKALSILDIARGSWRDIDAAMMAVIELDQPEKAEIFEATRLVMSNSTSAELHTKMMFTFTIMARNLIQPGIDSPDLKNPWRKPR